MIPIAIVTRNRAPYLDITLRSLSATDLPANQQLLIFDDASDAALTNRYLRTDHECDLSLALPRGMLWNDMGLAPARSRGTGRGIAKKIEVVRWDKQRGVVNGSSRAFTAMYERFRELDTGMIMLQDDVIFRKDWVEKLLEAVSRCKGEPPVGLMSGCVLNKRMKGTENPAFVKGGGITAQCYYVTPRGMDAVRSWCQQTKQLKAGFDNKFCANIRNGGLGIYRANPPVAQHFGTVSTVRPGWKWRKWHPKGRVDLNSKGPFAMASDVRKFL